MKYTTHGRFIMPNTTAPAAPYRFQVTIVSAKSASLFPTRDDAMNRIARPEFATYDEAMAVVNSGMKTAYQQTIEWRAGDDDTMECLVTDAKRTRISRFEVHAVGGAARDVLVSQHERKAGDLVHNQIVDPSTLLTDAPADDVAAAEDAPVADADGARPYRFQVRIVASAQCEILSRTPEDAMNRVTELEFATYDEAMAVVNSGMKTAWAATSEWRGDDPWKLECVITGSVRKRVKSFEVYATDAEHFHSIGTVLVSHHDRKAAGLVSTVVTDPSTLVDDAPAVEVTADPVTVAAAAAPVCADPELIQFDISRTTPVMTRSGRTFHSHFTCGAWTLGHRVDGLVRDLARDRAALAKLQQDPRRAWRRERLAASIAEGETRAVRIVTNWLVDPLVCTCRERVRVIREA